MDLLQPMALPAPAPPNGGFEHPSAIEFKFDYQLEVDLKRHKASLAEEFLHVSEVSGLVICKSCRTGLSPGYQAFYSHCRKPCHHFETKDIPKLFSSVSFILDATLPCRNLSVTAVYLETSQPRRHVFPVPRIEDFEVSDIFKCPDCSTFAKQMKTIRSHMREAHGVRSRSDFKDMDRVETFQGQAFYQRRDYRVYFPIQPEQDQAKTIMDADSEATEEVQSLVANMVHSAEAFRSKLDSNASTVPDYEMSPFVSISRLDAKLEALKIDWIFAAELAAGLDFRKEKILADPLRIWVRDNVEALFNAAKDSHRQGGDICQSKHFLLAVAAPGAVESVRPFSFKTKETQKKYVERTARLVLCLLRLHNLKCTQDERVRHVPLSSTLQDALNDFVLRTTSSPATSAEAIRSAHKLLCHVFHERGTLNDPVEPSSSSTSPASTMFFASVFSALLGVRVVDSAARLSQGRDVSPVLAALAFASGCCGILSILKYAQPNHRDEEFERIQSINHPTGKYGINVLQELAGKAKSTRSLEGMRRTWVRCDEKDHRHCGWVSGHHISAKMVGETVQEMQASFKRILFEDILQSVVPDPDEFMDRLHCLPDDHGDTKPLSSFAEQLKRKKDPLFAFCARACDKALTRLLKSSDSSQSILRKAKSGIQTITKASWNLQATLHLCCGAPGRGTEEAHQCVKNSRHSFREVYLYGPRTILIPNYSKTRSILTSSMRQISRHPDQTTSNNFKAFVLLAMPMRTTLLNKILEIEQATTLRTVDEFHNSECFLIQVPRDRQYPTEKMSNVWRSHGLPLAFKDYRQWHGGYALDKSLDTPSMELFVNAMNLEDDRTKQADVPSNTGDVLTLQAGHSLQTAKQHYAVPVMHIRNLDSRTITSFKEASDEYLRDLGLLTEPCQKPDPLLDNVFRVGQPARPPFQKIERPPHAPLEFPGPATERSQLLPQQETGIPIPQVLDNESPIWSLHSHFLQDVRVPLGLLEGITAGDDVDAGDNPVEEGKEQEQEQEKDDDADNVHNDGDCDHLLIGSSQPYLIASQQNYQNGTELTPTTPTLRPVSTQPSSYEPVPSFSVRQEMEIDILRRSPPLPNQPRSPFQPLLAAEPALSELDRLEQILKQPSAVPPRFPVAELPPTRLFASPKKAVQSRRETIRFPFNPNPQPLLALRNALRNPNATFRSSTQRDAMQIVCEGQEDLLLVDRTGGGKSAVIFGPCLAESGVTVYICPLQALQKDIVARCKRIGLPVTKINDVFNSPAQLPSHGLLLASPEAVTHRAYPEVLGTLYSMRKLCRVAIDEVHAIFLSDHFRPCMSRMRLVKPEHVQAQVVLMSATVPPAMTPAILESVGRKQSVKTLRGSFRRDNIQISVRHLDTADGPILIRKVLQQVQRELLRQHESGNLGKVIVTALTKLEVEKLFRKFREAVAAGECQSGALVILRHHSELSPGEKEKTMSTWLAHVPSRHGVLVIFATEGFCTGIDAPDVRAVIVAGCSRSLIEFWQAAGRAGRDDAPSYVTVLYHREYIKTARPSNRRALQLVQDFGDWADTVGTPCRVALLEKYFGGPDAAQECLVRKKPNGEPVEACDVCAYSLAEVILSQPRHSPSLAPARRAQHSPPPHKKLRRDHDVLPLVSTQVLQTGVPTTTEDILRLIGNVRRTAQGIKKHCVPCVLRLGTANERTLQNSTSTLHNKQRCYAGRCLRCLIRGHDAGSCTTIKKPSRFGGPRGCAACCLWTVRGQNIHFGEGPAVSGGNEFGSVANCPFVRLVELGLGCWSYPVHKNRMCAPNSAFQDIHPQMSARDFAQWLIGDSSTTSPGIVKFAAYAASTFGLP